MKAFDTLWSYNKWPIGFEGGLIPSNSNVTCLLPAILYHKFTEAWLYGNMFSISFLRWYVGIKWNKQPD